MMCNICDEEHEDSGNQCLKCYNDISPEFSYHASEYVCSDCDLEFPKLIHYLAENNCEMPEENNLIWKDLK